MRQSPGRKPILGNPGVCKSVPNKLGSLCEKRAPTGKESTRICPQECEQLAQSQCQGTPGLQLVRARSSPEPVDSSEPPLQRTQSVNFLDRFEPTVPNPFCNRSNNSGRRLRRSSNSRETNKNSLCVHLKLDSCTLQL